jgi:aerobic-type carbon monoxide dehydrogenase small subunit (CoxS/CutS family)
MLPEEARTIDALETEIRHVVEQAFKELREDAAFCGFSPDQPFGPA